MPRIHFQLQLAELKDKLLAMAALAQQATDSAVDAYLRRDAGLCQYVRENETDLIVDYKSGQPSETRLRRDRDQVAMYCRAMSAITGRPCKGLLWYIDVDVDEAIEVEAQQRAGVA